MATTPPGKIYLHEQLADFVRGLIEDGTFRPGDRVPSLRGIAGRFSVSLATATRAYEALEQRGWIEARPQSGFYVRTPHALDLEPPARGETPGYPERVDVQGLTRGLIAHDDAGEAVTLSLALPADELIPSKGLGRAISRAVRREPALAARYTFPPGLEQLRRRIAGQAVDAGCRVHPDDVLVTTGCSEALTIALSAVARPGDVVAVESPTFFKILTMIEALGMRALELPTDPIDGVDVAALERAFASGTAQAALLIPSFNNPLGSCMPESQRAAVADLAARYRVPVIEDDIYGDLYFGERRPPLLRAFDTSGWVLTASSFSKTIAPGYRIGWLLPGRFYERALHHQHAYTLGTSAVTQMGMTDFLASRSFPHHLRGLRRTYRGQVERMRYAIARAFPGGTRVSRPSGGFVLWVELPGDVDGTTIYQAALAEGIRVAPGTLFSTGKAYDGYIRISCGGLWNDVLDDAIHRLGRIVAGALPNDGPGEPSHHRAPLETQ